MTTSVEIVAVRYPATTSMPGRRELVRVWHRERNSGGVTGYAVALAGSSDAGGKPVYFRDGKLAADLTLPTLRPSRGADLR